MKICGYFFFFFFFWGGGGGGGVITKSDYLLLLCCVFFFGGGGGGGGAWGGSFLYILGLFKVKIPECEYFFGRKISIWVQIYTSSLALYGGLGIRMLQMTRLEA